MANNVRTIPAYTLTELNYLLGRCVNAKDTRPNTIVICMRIKKQIEKVLKSNAADCDELLRQYKIIPITTAQGPQYDWKGHKDEKIISAAINLIRMTEYEIDHLNQISEEEFIKHTRGLSEQEMSLLWDYLVIVEKAQSKK